MIEPELERDGFAWASCAFEAEVIEAVVRQTSASPPVAGVRNALEAFPAARALAGDAALRSVVEAFLGAPAFVVRALLFDKTRASNWNLRWHQDVTVAVLASAHVDGFSGWSTKGGVTHVRAPEVVLRSMLAARIHLDDCGRESGPLLVLPGTHQKLLPEAQVPKLASTESASECLAQRGQVLLMRPLLVHASKPATGVGHRRVLHLEFASHALPDGLSWRWRE